MKTLNVIETAYRATLEEQDDPIVWIVTAMKGAGADVGVLLTGNAVNYAVKGQDSSGLRFGARQQTHSPHLEADLQRLLGKGVDVHIVEEDVSERGLERHELIAGLKPVSRAGVAQLYDAFDRIWHW
jgi:sulfur relay (sulfurtransferase) DsrF/TusC family protein